jgi:uncharacterized protein
MIDVVVLFFIFGVVAGLARSELKLPAALYDTLSLVLLLTIGMKGGEGLAKQALAPLAPQLLLVVVLGVVQTLFAFAALLKVGRLNRIDSAAIAAHYGSVSVATFAVGVNWLNNRSIDFEPQLAIFLAVMEVPAIMVGIVLARGIGRNTQWGSLLHETFLGKGVTLLLGGKGALALFLLEMGLIVSKQVSELKRRGLFILAFGVVMPLLSACAGLGCGWLMELSVGGCTLLATLAASASYIAVPAAMRIALPEANPGVSLAAVLGITFPFNILVGIPLYYRAAAYMMRSTL